MNTGIIVLGGNSNNMVYVTYEQKNKQLPMPSIPVISNSDENILNTTKTVTGLSNVVIVDVFVSSNYIPGENILMVVCKSANKNIPFVSCGNATGFIYLKLLLDREFEHRFSEKEKIKLIEDMNLHRF